MVDAPYEPSGRRPLASRNLGVIQRFATLLVRWRVSPNFISVLSMIFALGAGASLWLTASQEGAWERCWWLAAAGLMQLRLLANLFDGMVALESQTASPVGELFNEVPDRISDPLILIGAGYAVGGSPILGFVAALVALLTSYVRAMGALTGAGQVFCGPMAKPQRMFVLTVACLYFGLSPDSWRPIHEESGWGIMAGVLGVIIVGGMLTVARRLVIISSILKGGLS